MLSSIRKFSTSIYSKILLGIVVIPFVFWGMGGAFKSGNKNIIVKIENEKHSIQEFVDFVENSSRNKKINVNEIENLRSTSVFFVSGNRLMKFLQGILEIKINRAIAICKEITKKNERVFRGNVKKVIEEISTDEKHLKGEFVVVIEGKEKKSTIKVDSVIENQMIKLLKKFSLTDVVEIVHKLTNISKKEIYKTALLNKNG